MRLMDVTLLSLVCCCDALRLPVSRRAVLIAVPAVAVPVAASADTVLHILDYPKKGLCGEASVPDNVVKFLEAFGGFRDGECAVDGYTKAVGTANGTGDKDKEKEYSLYDKE